MCFTIFLCVFMSDILIHTPPYFLMWSISGHPVSARLAGLSNPRIPLLLFLLSWDYKYSPQCLIFFWGYWVSELMFLLLQSKQCTYWTSLKPQCGSLLSLEDCFVFIERWFLFTFECWLYFSLFLLFSLKKITYIPSTFCFHFFLPFLLPLIIIIIIL